MTSKKPQNGLAAVYSGGDQGGRLFFLRAEEHAEEPNINSKMTGLVDWGSSGLAFGRGEWSPDTRIRYGEGPVPE